MMMVQNQKIHDGQYVSPVVMRINLLTDSEPDAVALWAFLDQVDAELGAPGPLAPVDVADFDAV